VPENINQGGACTPLNPGGDTRCVDLSRDTGFCLDGFCQPGNLPDGTSCSLNPPTQCQTGACEAGSCQAINAPANAPCFPVASNLCYTGYCGNIPATAGVCFPFPGNPLKTCPDACGTGTTCDPTTGSCGGVEPSFGQVDCSGALGSSGPDVSKCCPGQVCICGPLSDGIPQVCFSYGCWNPADVPTNFPL
jgi:hypothetical protein